MWLAMTLVGRMRHVFGSFQVRFTASSPSRTEASLVAAGCARRTGRHPEGDERDEHDLDEPGSQREPDDRCEHASAQASAKR
jgi:hypothetical protein